MSERSTDLTNTFTWHGATSARVDSIDSRGQWGVSTFDGVKNEIAVYLRVSATDQNVDNQLPIIETYMKANFPYYANTMFTNMWDEGESRGFDLYWDHESGRGHDDDSSRKAFSVLYNAIQRKKYKHVICWHVDRASRNVEQFSRLLRISRAAGCTWHFASLGLHTGDPMFEFMAKFFSLWAEHEVALKDKRQKEGIARRRAAGLHMGRQPNMQYDDEVFELMFANPDISVSSVARHFNKSRDWARRTMKRVSERSPSKS